MTIKLKCKFTIFVYMCCERKEKCFKTKPKRRVDRVTRDKGNTGKEYTRACAAFVWGFAALHFVCISSIFNMLLGSLFVLLPVFALFHVSIAVGFVNLFRLQAVVEQLVSIFLYVCVFEREKVSAHCHRK